ncbi:MAG TPA: hypothetical protein DGK91_07230 [Clostridium sp.]|jgi:hypothetical protein|nr:hypothetical protein [Clostridium sp.]
MSRFVVEEAVRTKIYPKIGIFSPSGGGKTYTALRLATGMVEEYKNMGLKKTEIWLANNEGSRGKYYANEFKYKIIELEPPHEPEMYYDLIDFAENSETCGVLIIDSLSKEWAGEGGCLDIANSMGGTFQNAWKKVTPRHRRLMDKLVDSHLTIIATMRGEDQYTMETDQDGKNRIVKLGVGARTGKDFEYEFTITFSLDQKTNSAENFKDNTHLFENRALGKLTEQDGINIIKWANSSDVEPVKRELKPKEPIAEDRVANGIKAIKKLVGKLESEGVDKKVISDTIKQHHVNNNYNSITDIEVATSVYKALEKISKEDDR